MLLRVNISQPARKHSFFFSCLLFLLVLHNGLSYDYFFISATYSLPSVFHSKSQGWLGRAYPELLNIHHGKFKQRQKRYLPSNMFYSLKRSFSEP